MTGSRRPEDPVRRLTRMNRELRRPMADALAKRRLSPEEWPLLPLLYLATKALQTHESILILCDRGAGLDATMLSRSMFEAAVDAMWLASDLEPRSRPFFDHTHVVTKKFQDTIARSPLATPELLEQLKAQRASVDANATAAKQRRGGRGQNWSGKTIRQMAVELDLGHQYDMVYGLASEIEHSSVAGIPFYLAQGPDGFRARTGSTREWVRATLQMAHWFLLATFQGADAYLELGLEDHLTAAREQLRTLGG